MTQIMQSFFQASKLFSAVKEFLLFFHAPIRRCILKQLKAEFFRETIIITCNSPDSIISILPISCRVFHSSHFLFYSPIIFLNETYYSALPEIHPMWLSFLWWRNFPRIPKRCVYFRVFERTSIQEY